MALRVLRRDGSFAIELACGFGGRPRFFLGGGDCGIWVSSTIIVVSRVDQNVGEDGGEGDPETSDNELSGGVGTEVIMMWLIAWSED